MPDKKKLEFFLITVILVCLGISGALAFCISNEIVDIEVAKSIMIVPLVTGGLLSAYSLLFRNVQPFWVSIIISGFAFGIPILIQTWLFKSGTKVDTLFGIPIFWATSLIIKYFESPIIKLLVEINERLKR